MSRKVFLLLAFICFVACGSGFSATNLIGDFGSFEEWSGDPLLPDGWYLHYIAGKAEAISRNSTFKVDGNYSLQIKNEKDTDYNLLAYDIEDLEKNTDYTIIFWIKGENIKRGPGGLAARIYTNFGSSPAKDGTFDWTQVKFTVNTGSRTSIGLRAYLHHSTGTVWFDGIEVYLSSVLETSKAQLNGTL